MFTCMLFSMIVKVPFLVGIAPTGHDCKDHETQRAPAAACTWSPKVAAKVTEMNQKLRRRPK